MQEENMNEEINEETVIPDERETLMQRAKMMGIKVHPATGIDKLRAKIDAKLTGETQGLDEEQVEAMQEKVGVKTKLPANAPKDYQPISHEKFLQERSRNKRREINRLVRIRATCMNPNKTEWEGEIISVGSAKLGTFKKYVPFNAPDGYHVPKIIYDAMKERKYSQFYNAKDARGRKVRKAKLMPEFSIEVLPPLTKEELKDLASRQAMARGSDST
jgi:hypothetical protein